MTSRVVFASVSMALFLLGACGSDSPPAGTAPPTPVGQVPDYIDLDVCAHITESMSLSFSGECQSCCKTAGFADSSSINDDKCTCGNMPDTGGSTACASQTASSDVCSNCCMTAGYQVNFWVGGTGARCECAGKSDDVACASATSDSSACAHCCLGKGFLGFGFIGIGAPSCSCHGK